jgi:hypothetical protein
MVASRAVLVVFLTAVLSGCEKTTGHGSPKSLEEFAAGWSGGQAQPTCTDRPPPGEFLYDYPGAKYCEWPTVARGAEWSRVRGHQDSLHGITDIRWARRFHTVNLALQLTDSLSREFVSQGLRERACPNGVRHWETKNLGVQLLRDTLPNGTWVVTVFATIAPEAIPDLFCPRSKRRQA